MLLEALDAEQFRADWLFGIRSKSGGRSLQSAKEPKIHTCLSVPETRQRRGAGWFVGRFISLLSGRCTFAIGPSSQVVLARERIETCNSSNAGFANGQELLRRNLIPRPAPCACAKFYRACMVVPREIRNTTSRPDFSAATAVCRLTHRTRPCAMRRSSDDYRTTLPVTLTAGVRHCSPHVTAILTNAVPSFTPKRLGAS
jgi:hypothetical protein